MPFLDDLLDATDAAETPKPFIYWAGLACISAVTKRNVWFDKTYYKVFPNIFVMLYGNPGTRKSFASNLSKNLVAAVGNTRIISGTNSVEGIIKDLGTTSSPEDGGPPLTMASAFVTSNEFTNLLIDNPQALSYLTELYDACYNEIWEKKLVSGKITLKEPTITFLTATNPAHFQDKISSKDIEGGFIGRSHLVVCNKKNRINALVRKPEKKFNYKDLVPALREISTIKGEFNFENEEVIAYYENWYQELCERGIEDKTGASERIQDHVLKIAMLLSLSEKKETVFTMKNILMAIRTCNELTVSIKTITAGAGISDISAQIRMFLGTLITAKDNQMEHAVMLSRHYGDFDVHEMGKIIETLYGAGIIDILRTGNKSYYKITGEAIKKHFSKDD